MIVPIHGIVISALLHHRIAVQNDAVTGVLPSQTRIYEVEDRRQYRVGEQIDAFLDVRTHRLFDARPARTFVAGSYNPSVTHVLAAGDKMPSYTLVDQRGTLVKLDGFTGKVTLLSFIFSRCPDANLCPAISGKFAYLQRQLDPKRFHLIEVTLDPRYDSPAVLAKYGAQYGADPSRWSLLTGQPAQIGDVIDTFGVASIQNRPDNFVHDDRLAIVDRSGTIRDIVPTAGWNPDDVVAEARSVAGLSSNPLRRMQLAAIAQVVSMCGGSTTIGNVMLDSAVFLLGVGILGGLLAWFGKQIFVKES